MIQTSKLPDRLQPWIASGRCNSWPPRKAEGAGFVTGAAGALGKRLVGTLLELFLIFCFFLEGGGEGAVLGLFWSLFMSLLFRCLFRDTILLRYAFF